MGKGRLAALKGRHGKATWARCDASTVSSPPDAGTSKTALCVIFYSDSSVWRQKVTVRYDSQGKPVDHSADVGTELAAGTSPGPST
jgi:hypothetical protein